MIKIALQDDIFSHAHTIGNGDYKVSTKYFTWDRVYEQNRVTVYTDHQLQNGNNNTHVKKIGLLMESPAITTRSYSLARTFINNYDVIFTFDKELLDVSNRFKFYQLGGCWISIAEQLVYPKNKNICFITSSKGATDGQCLRMKIVKECKGFDLFGRGFRQVQHKVDALKSYRFCIVVENCKKDYYFSEKLIDCFKTGTIPIYWGCDISKFFNMKGVVTFNSIQELSSILLQLNDRYYNDSMEAVMDNFQIANKYTVVEDNLWENGLNEFVKKE
jgi:hypothetical protein